MACSSSYATTYIDLVESETEIADRDNLLRLITAVTKDGTPFVDQCRPATVDQLIYLYLYYYGIPKLSQYRSGERETMAVDATLKRLAGLSRDDAMFLDPTYKEARQYDARVTLMELAPRVGVGEVYDDCPNCYSNNYKIEVKQTRAADEGSTTILTCLECGRVDMR